MIGRVPQVGSPGVPQHMCGEARTKPAGKMHCVNVGKQSPLGLHRFCQRGIRKRFGFVASRTAASRTHGQAGVLGGLQRAPRQQFGVPLSGTAADGRQRSRPRSESLQRFAEATIVLRTRRAKEANRVDSSLATAAVCCKAGNATGCRNLMASTCIVDEAVVRTCGGIMKPETGMQLGIAHAAAHSFSMGSSCL